MDGYDVMTEKDKCDAISYYGGIAVTNAVLFDGGALEGPVLRNNKEFKASKTAVRETHEVVWTNPTPQVYTMSDLTVPKVVTQRKLNNYQCNARITSTSKMIKSDKNHCFSKKCERNKTSNKIEQINQTPVVQKQLMMHLFWST